MKKEKVVIISDAGIDDILAILFLSKRQEICIERIIAVSGNGTCLYAQSVLEYFFPTMSNIIYSWENTERSSRLPRFHIHGNGRIGEVIVENCEANAMELENVVLNEVGTILSLASSSLLAKMVEAQKCLSVRQIVMMGGAIENGIGNDNPYAEYNFMLDPNSSNVILKSQFYPTIIPLDVTRSVTYGIELERCLDGDLKKIYQFLYARYLELGQNCPPIHDLTAASYLIAPDAFTLKYRHAEVSTEPVDLQGCLLIDQHMYSRKSANCLLAFSPEISRIKYEVVSTLLG